jgi:parallel beta-helix repeat protein
MRRKIISCILLIVFISLIQSGCFEKTNNPVKTSVYIENKGSYNTIQEAINAAENDDTIHVLNGSYNELLIIDKSISLIGESQETTFIVYQEPAIVSGDIIFINADNCTIEGLTIIGSSSSEVIGISVNSSNNIITNIAVSNTSEGINLRGKTKNNNITQNTIFNNKKGIYSSFGSENNISANNIFSNSEYGIYISLDSNNNLISGNKIYDNAVGFRLKGSKFNNVFKNEFNNNSNRGLYICCGAKNNIIYYNSFIKNFEHVDYAVSYENYFYKDGFGNYWDDYLERYPNATQLNGVWDTSYQIPTSSFEDKYPLVEPVDI